MKPLLIQQMVNARIPLRFGEFQLFIYGNNRDDKEHMALVMGNVENRSHLLVRIHSECFTGDVLGSERCDCGEQLHAAMESIAHEGAGVIVYLRQEGRGIGLVEKLRAYNLQDNGYDTIEANLALGHSEDEREYSMGAAILNDLRVNFVRLLTNNPEKIIALDSLGIRVVERVPLLPTVTRENSTYLLTKALRMNHLLDAGLFAPIESVNHNGNSHR